MTDTDKVVAKPCPWCKEITYPTTDAICIRPQVNHQCSVLGATIVCFLDEWNNRTEGHVDELKRVRHELIKWALDERNSNKAMLKISAILATLPGIDDGEGQT